MCGGLFEPSQQTNTSKSTMGPDKQYQQAYSSILKQAQGIAQTPYDPATESQVAGFAQPQFDAFSNVYANQGIASPYVNQAFGYAQQGAAPSYANVDAYMNPYQQNVIDATQAQFDTQNQRQLMGVRADAARQGALGGSGRQVAEALTREAQMNAQNPVIAGLYSQGYNQALGAAQTDASRQLQASGVMGNLGGQAQQYGLNDINALLGIGGMQQGLQQQQYDTATANAQQRAAYPYQNLQWLSGIASGLGGASGTTTTGTQTTPGPSVGQQLIGGGLAALSFLSTGGRVGYDGGGVVMPFAGANSYIPEIGLSAMHGGGPSPSLAQASGPQSSNGMGDLLSSYKQAQGALSGLGSLGQKMRTSHSPGGGSEGTWATTVNPSGMSGWDNFLGNTFGFAKGGGVRPGYQDGGDVIDLYDDGTGVYGMEDAWSNPAFDDSGMAGVAPIASLPPPQAPVQPGGIAPVTTPEAAEQGGGMFGWSPAAKNALLQAGLGIMASRSPNVGVALGEGGLMGAQSYQDSLAGEKARQLAREKIAQSAAALQERARMAAEALNLRREQAQGLIPYRDAQMRNWDSLAAAREKQAALQDAILGMLTQGGGGEGQPIPLPEVQTPEFRPQSFQGSGTLPGVTLASDLDQTEDERADAGTVAPDLAVEEVADAAPAASAAQDGDTIDTPYGRMSRSEALRKGGAMMLMPQYAQAGKTLVELAQAKSDPGLAKPTVNQLEERTLNSAAQLARLDDIEKRFQPQWLEIPKRLEMLGAGWSAKLGPSIGGKLAPEKQGELRDYASFRSASVNNLNTILKELSGAAVTPQEYERIQNDQPVAGTGVFDGDDPVSFRAKLDRTKQTLKAAIARYNFMRSKGLNFDKNSMDQFMGLDDVPAAIDQRASELEQQMLKQSPKADKSVIQKRVDQQLKREFGI